MLAEYPKKPENVALKETREKLDPGARDMDACTTLVTNLSNKMRDYLSNEYLNSLGYTKGHVLGIVVQLLTHGKIKVEFRDYRERLELLDKADRLTRIQAVALFDDFIEELDKMNISRPPTRRNITGLAQAQKAAVERTAKEKV